METSHRDLGGQEIWRLYTTLVKVEEAFRDVKTNLGFRSLSEPKRIFYIRRVERTNDRYNYTDKPTKGCALPPRAL